MPDTWEYREPQQPPRHPPTRVVLPQQPNRYSQPEHISRLQPSRPDESPATGRQPAFTPVATPPQPQAWQRPPPRAQGNADAWGAPPDDPWQASTGQPAGPRRYQPPQGYFPPPAPVSQPPRYVPSAQQPPQQPPRPPRRNRHTGRNILAGIGALIILIIVINAANNSHGTSGAGPGTQTQTAAPTAQGASQAPAQTPAGAPAKTKPAGTVSELEALTAAENYLSDGTGFSRQGLIDQLDSSYGDNFSVADATWGVEHSGANWDAQAVDCAKGYMSDGQGFSRQGLIEQMTSSYGNKFTEAQAEYAASAVGL